MNGRMYDPLIARMLSTDNYVQAGGFTQSYNRYSYVWNNPLKFTDPDGEIVAQVVGGILGGYSGYKLGQAMGATGLELAGYTLGGTLVGVISGGIGSIVSTGGGIAANTMGIVAASATNSAGMLWMSGGRTDFSVGFGAGSYNFSTGELGYLGKEGNSKIENVGYGLGALSNLADLNLLMNSTKAEVFTDHTDFISHSAIREKSSGDILMSFGPNDSKTPNTMFGFAFKFRRSTSDYTLHDPSPLTVDVTVNKYSVGLVRGLGKVLPYQGATINCVNMSSLSLWLNGIPNIGLHPYLLYASTYAYSVGFRPDLFSYYLYQNRR